MTEKFYIAAYCRISLDDDLNKENILIENQKAIIEDYVKTNFTNAELDFYEDRDKSGYTFEQREGYQKMRRKLFRNQYDILIIKNLSRFSRRNGVGLVEPEAYFIVIGKDRQKVFFNPISSRNIISNFFNC